ncbi:MAG: O-antigen ligase family protein [Planctomycetota bacterium]
MNSQNRSIESSGSFRKSPISDSFSLLSTVFYTIPLCSVPWLMGGNLPFVRLGLSVFALLSLFGALLLSFSRSSDFPRRLPIPIWIVVITLILTGIQTFLVSPEQGGSEIPSESRERYAELLVYAGIGLTSAIGFASLLRAKLFLALIVANAAIFSLFGIFQQLSYNGKIYWSYELISGGVPFAAFVNRNNAAGYLLMGLAASLYFWVRRDRYSTGSIAWRNRFAGIQTQDLYSYSATIMIGVGVLATISRGGMVSLAVTVGAVGLLFATRFRSSLSYRGLALGGLILLVFGLIFVAGDNATSRRLSTLNDWSEASRARLEHWSNVTPYLSEYLLTGSGLGTYRHCYPLFQEQAFEAWYLHAENQYIESLSETGIAGLALYITLFVSIGWISLRLMNVESQKMKSPLSIAPSTFGLGLVGFTLVVTQLCSGMFDFGLYLPANASLMASITGLVIGTASVSLPARNSKQGSPNWSTLWLGRMIIVATLALLGWAAIEISATESRRVVRRAIERFSPAEGELNHRYQQALDWAAYWRPDDFRVDYQQGLFYVSQFRFKTWETLTQTQRELLEEAAKANNQAVNDVASSSSSNLDEQNELEGSEENSSVTIDLEALWQVTSLSSLHRAYTREKIPMDAGTKQLIDKWLRPAEEAFQDAVSKGNWSPRSHIRLAQLNWIHLSENSASASDEIRDVSHLDDKLSRWPDNPELLYHTGLIAFDVGDIKTGCEQWQRCLEIGSPKYSPLMIALARRDLPMRILFEKLLPQEPVRLVQLSHNLFGKPEDELVRRFLLKHTATLSDGLLLDRSDHRWVLAEMSAIEGQNQVAENHFRKAIEMSPNSALPKLAFGRFLIGQQRLEEAERLIRACLVSGDQTKLVSDARAELRRIKQIRRQRPTRPKPSFN